MTRTYLLILFFCAALTGFSQQGTTGATNRSLNRFATVEAAHKELLDSVYSIRTGTGYAFINGNEYFPYHYRASNKPLLFYGEERTADIVVKGRKYEGMVLQYDTFTDEVIFSEIDNDFGSNLYQVSIKRDLISTFTLCFRTDTMRFRYLSAGETGGEIPEGFYEMAYNGPTGYIIRHRCVVHQRNGIDEYYYSPVGYVMTPYGYRKVTSGGNFMKAFGDGSAEMKKIIDQQKLKLRKAGKRQMINVLQTYDSRRAAAQGL